PAFEVLAVEELDRLGLALPRRDLGGLLLLPALRGGGAGQGRGAEQQPGQQRAADTGGSHLGLSSGRGPRVGRERRPTGGGGGCKQKSAPGRERVAAGPRRQYHKPSTPPLSRETKQDARFSCASRHRGSPDGAGACQVCNIGAGRL